MSAPRQEVLLDSNAYFRLGISIERLLRETFGPPPPYSLHILDELEKEYARSQRLRHKFGWVVQPEHLEDRRIKRYVLRGAALEDADRAFGFLVAHADACKINLSRADLRALAVGLIKGIPVVTDDAGMVKVASDNEIECWSVIKLLRVMETEGRIDAEKVTEVLEYWQYENDLPMGLGRLRREFRTYFGRDCPI